MRQGDRFQRGMPVDKAAISLQFALVNFVIYYLLLFVVFYFVSQFVLALYD